VPTTTGSVLLVVPEGVNQPTAAQDFLVDQHQAGQPVFFNSAAETLKIDMVREVLQHLSFARSKIEPQVVVICTGSTATLPAQNALLKIVEEPPAHTQIILVVNSGHQLLPTLISRCREIIWTKSQAESTDQEDLPDKIKQVKLFIQNPSDWNYGDLILLAEQLSTVETAKQVLRTVLTDAILMPQSIVSAHITRQLLSALDSLEKNGNVRLSLEHCFFTIKGQITQTA
jgi:hypothetical protein